jgi:1-acyl-sn-glycerol-3-phosphate acyltransferase
MAIAVDHRHVAFAARRSLIDNAFLRFIFARVGVILVEPGRGHRATLRRMIEHVEAGDALGIFPEGTRSLDGDLSDPKKGALLVARTTGAPIIPCAISGTREAWPRGGRWPRRGKVCIEFAAAVDGSRPDALDVAWQSISAMLSKPSEPDFGPSDQAIHNNP